ncbi:hypothetical protein IT6_03505 [Methylacidiphilum caldifontis]|uniref:hypothetical protein n=1 Tax=Methylacidiphilum caldifontis TaxID=2795386 RepID=UPI001A8F3E23|nr:hypothetical protein [Methylacidiphilum caldifontis]QSR89358.1 hypothetical protein IT6_03505 [Methylacidiphilum caldifontis]
MRVVFAEQVPKEPSFPDVNEDVLELRRSDIGRIAVSDGASESFDSKRWAKLLTARFVQNPKLDKTWLDSAISDYQTQFNPAQMSWSQQAAFDRGSFATLLGIEQLVEHNSISIFSVGDSIAVFLDGNDLIDSFPYRRAEEFQQRPELFSTNAALNDFFSSPDFSTRYYKTWSLMNRKAPVVLCMTDAIGEWFLRAAQEGNHKWRVLTKIRDISDFESLVLQERQSENMRIDDTTLVRLAFDAIDNDELPYP